MRSTTTAASTRSPRNFGKMTPRLTAPTWWPARLEVLLDLDALLTADGPLVRAGDVLAIQLVQPGAEPLREASRVGEHDRGVVRPDQLQQPFVDVGPDAAPLRVVGRFRTTEGEPIQTVRPGERRGRGRGRGRRRRVGR